VLSSQQEDQASKNIYPIPSFYFFFVSTYKKKLDYNRFSRVISFVRRIRTNKHQPIARRQRFFKKISSEPFRSNTDTNKNSERTKNTTRNETDITEHSDRMHFPRNIFYLHHMDKLAVHRPGIHYFHL